VWAAKADSSRDYDPLLALPPVEDLCIAGRNTGDAVGAEEGIGHAVGAAEGIGHTVGAAEGIVHTVEAAEGIVQSPLIEHRVQEGPWRFQLQQASERWAWVQA